MTPVSLPVPAHHLVTTVIDPSQVGEARRMATDLAARHGFDDSDRGRLAIVVTELATNLVKHGSGGEILLRASSPGDIEVLALDCGHGMRNVDCCLSDGFSTTGSSGTGLGAVARLADRFEVYSGEGTAVLATVAAHRRVARSVSTLDVGVINVPKPGQEVSGDDWIVDDHAGGTSVMVADGLGHGLLAMQAAKAAVETLRRNARLRPAEAVETMHAALRPTRGAAVGLAEIDVDRQMVRFCGVGNIAAAVLMNGAMRQMVSHHGTLGHEARHIAEFTYPWSGDALLVVHSDGLATHWALDRYAGLAAHHPSVVAGLLYRDFKRGRDDVTVVVARQARAA
jgi:anti-sigma regulatory factor (Ser/Thr protein kinase)